MKNVIFKGTGTALITPMREGGSINYPVFKELIEMQIRGPCGCRYYCRDHRRGFYAYG